MTTTSAPRYETTTVTAGPAKILVRRAGTGAPLVLLPGLGRPTSDLDALAAIFVAAGRRVVLPEPRGMDTSTGPLEGITLHDLARDVGAVIEAENAAPATIVAHAFGNRVARCLAADRPDLVKAVVLLSASGKVQPTPEIAEAIKVAQAVDTPPDARRRAAKAAWFSGDNDPTPWLTGWSQPVMKAFLAAAAATDTNHWWTAGKAKLLIVQGLDDVSAPPGNGRLIREEVGPRATLVELGGVGHALAIENPRKVGDAVLGWLKSV
jgi:pimeloyl-ACP methyl ester carboxylesterase